MSDSWAGLKLGQIVPDFELTTYDPVTGDFEKFGLDLRGTFIINPEGKLLNTEMNFYNLGRNIDEMMRKFKANIYMSKKTNEVCPSKWKDEGDKTLVDPGAKMAGKVHEALNT